MKNISYFKEQIVDVINGREPYCHWKETKVQKHLKFFRECVRLLETSPKGGFSVVRKRKAFWVDTIHQWQGH